MPEVASGIPISFSRFGTLLRTVGTERSVSFANGAALAWHVGLEADFLRWESAGLGDATDLIHTKAASVTTWPSSACALVSKVSPIIHSSIAATRPANSSFRDKCRSRWRLCSSGGRTCRSPCWFPPLLLERHACLPRHGRSHTWLRRRCGVYD